MHVESRTKLESLAPATANLQRWGAGTSEPAALPRVVLDGSLMTPFEDAYEGPAWLGGTQSLGELSLEYDREKGVLWWFMTPSERPSFTEALLAAMHTFANGLEAVYRRPDAHNKHPLRYLVLGSRLPGVFNLGGNLDLFLKLIEAKDRKRLTTYARNCSDGQHRIAERFGLPVCTIALVQGDALGGGFEAALAHDVIIAERSSKFGLPEILFGMFPGMGAYSFLSRRLCPADAERMILSGRTYAAEELHEMGIVDAVAEDNRGVDGVHEYIAKHERIWGAKKALLQARNIVRPIAHQELIDIVDLWVETAMTLTEAELRRMRHLAKAQDRRWARQRPH